MRYNPSDANANLIPDKTWHDALIVEAVEGHSKAGNEMIVADFQVWDNATNPTIKHYFVSSMPGMFKKLCFATGLDYESGNIEASTLKGLEVKVLVKIQKDTTGQYSDKNVIAAFAKDFPEGASVQPGTREPLPGGPEEEADIPF